MSWDAGEFKDLELGDARRTQRLIKLVDDLSAQPTGASRWPAGLAGDQGRLPVAGQPGGRVREILEVHTTRNRGAAGGQPVVLCIQDTTPSGFHVATGGLPGWGG